MADIANPIFNECLRVNLNLDQANLTLEELFVGKRTPRCGDVLVFLKWEEMELKQVQSQNTSSPYFFYAIVCINGRFNWMLVATKRYDHEEGAWKTCNRLGALLDEYNIVLEEAPHCAGHYRFLGVIELLKKVSGKTIQL